VLDSDKWFHHTHETLTAIVSIVNGSISKQVSVSIELNDLPAILTIENQLHRIPENPDPNSNWNYDLVATSDEGLEDLSFSITNQSVLGAFTINEATGVISFGNLDLFNYELYRSLEADVLVSQRGVDATSRFKIELEDQVLHVNEGLMAYYPFNNSVIDESGNGHDGSIEGAVFSGPNRWGEANKGMHFGGGSISIPGFGDNLNQFTIAAWVFDGNTSQGYRTILSKGGTNREYVLRIAESTNCDCINLHYSSGTNSINCPTAFPKTQWKHVLFTYDNGMTKLYINGSEVNSKSMTPVNWNNGDIRIGGISNTSIEGFRGRIDEVVFLDRVITQSEMNYLVSH